MGACAGLQTDGQVAVQTEELHRHDDCLQADAYIYQVSCGTNYKPCEIGSERTPHHYNRSAVTRNYSEKVINKVLDLVSGSQQMDLLQTFYETTLAALQAKLTPASTFNPFFRLSSHPFAVDI